ncbi:hypothetical protein [Lentzea sp. NBRC 102530]|uniref:DUF7850 domain-containing protein n=1 Tax=Lentzea sp. NBRC 102530 TaxID=3032201 RepID=UPI0024A1DEF8|nr:hypothetical protein [Lentzea sp. NBRC 102530]GLY54359.1 hypothetical protein Lesp01_80150 [Lentzea sp. NBRC 102530]
MRELLCAAVLLLGPPTGADPGMPGCTGGVAPEPRAGVIVGPGTTGASLEAVEGGVYDLSVWAGSRRPGPATATGLQFSNASGTPLRTYTLNPERQLKRLNSYGMIAPPGTTTARFFATTTTEIHWDCVYLRVSAYAATHRTGQVTVTSTGSEPLTNLTLTGCGDPTPFDLKDQVTRTCEGTGPITVTGALYWNGALPGSSVVRAQDPALLGNEPQHPGRRQLQDR